MYKSSNDPGLLNDINNRLEFVELTGTKKTPGVKFEFSSAQLFCRNYINPWSPYTRIINKAGVGVGKTLMALLVAKEFVNEDRNVIVISYQQDRFLEEIVSRPELGFVTQTEANELERLQRLSRSGTPEALKSYRDYRTKLRRRNKGITFYGYGEFANRIFDRERLANPKVNYELIESLRHGCIICDEIHNAYNALEQNNWGKTIQFVINLLGPDIHLMIQSATPLTNSTEISDFLSLLADSPKLSLKKIKYGHKNEQKKVIEQIINFDYPTLEHLKLPSEPSDDQIAERIKGKVIFIPDSGIESMPKRVTYGEYIQGIKYLKFIRVKMSPEQEEASKFNPHNYQLRDIGGLVELSEYSKEADIAKDESPEYDREQFVKNVDNIDENTVRISELKLLSVNQNRSNKIKINTIRTSEGIYLQGEGLKYDSLMNYSPKYCKLLDLIFNADHGKILIYHHYVHGTGVLTIQEIFRENGIIGENDSPNDFTKCYKCAKIKKSHEGSDHPYVPMRYISIHNKLDKSTTDKYKIKFNSLTNLHGEEFRILLGSRKIKEGIDFKAVKTQIIIGLPTNMSIFLQVLGRTVRTMSHENLPREEWIVNTYILICQYKDKYDKHVIIDKSSAEGFDDSISSPEELDYKKKVDDFIKIQKYEMIINRNAVDGHIMDTVNRISINKDNILRPLDYELEPINKLSDTAKVTYFALERYKDEINTIRYLIIDAFKIKNVWNVFKLWEYIKTMSGTPNPAYFDIRNYMITLKSMSSLKSNNSINIIDEFVIRTSREIESFVRKDVSHNEVKLMRVNNIKESSLLNSVINRVNLFAVDKNIKGIDIFDVFENYNIDLHIRLIEKALINANNPQIIEKESDKLNNDQFNKIIRFYKNILDLKTSKDVGIQNINNDSKTPIGYVYNSNLKYITKIGWKSYPYIDQVQENNIIIGMFSPEMHFKMRDPIKTSKVGENIKNIDMRKIQRGANCFTRNKVYLTKIINKLDIDMSNDTVYDLCGLIKKELIKRESEKKDNLKWFYFTTKF